MFPYYSLLIFVAPLVVIVLIMRRPPRLAEPFCTLFQISTVLAPGPIWRSFLKGFRCCWATSDHVVCYYLKVVPFQIWSELSRRSVFGSNKRLLFLPFRCPGSVLLRCRIRWRLFAEWKFYWSPGMLAPGLPRVLPLLPQTHSGALVSTPIHSGVSRFWKNLVETGGTTTLLLGIAGALWRSLAVPVRRWRLLFWIRSYYLASHSMSQIQQFLLKELAFFSIQPKVCFL